MPAEWTAADADGNEITLEAKGGDPKCAHDEMSYGMASTKALCVLCGAWIYVKGPKSDE